MPRGTPMTSFTTIPGRRSRSWPWSAWLQATSCHGGRSHEEFRQHQTHVFQSPAVARLHRLGARIGGSSLRGDIPEHHRGAAHGKAARFQLAENVRRSGPEYTLQCVSRRNPTSVSPDVTARLTARLEGAPMAASTLTPARMAFCTSSKLARPLNMTTRSVRGRAPDMRLMPTSLSKAL